MVEDGDDNAIIYVDHASMNILKWQWERQQADKERLVLPGWIIARDVFKLYRGEAGGPQDPEKASANARQHSPGYTKTPYGRRRAEGAKKPAASSAARIGLSSPV
ncbi:hypothetical protein ACFVG1_30905 [Streptomyces bacillaris]|uniref:hypothetical protein n=1 Tax=Streptomyces bacillaris TaxID=68179 RepID=UPI00335CAB39